MFDQYMICEETVRNVREEGQLAGFSFEVRLAYYRSLRLSMVEPFGLLVDGERIAEDAMRFGLRGRTYTLSELEDETTQRWEFGERATLTVLRPGGLPPGEHSLELTETLRISYMPVPSVTRFRKSVTVAERA
jgi:Domain of unknown function (DUF6379)